MNKVFITGVTGFIGGRLAEMAFAREIPVVGLVRNWSRAARLARLSVQMVQGDILDLASVREAMQGCEVVFHCAVDNRVGGAAHRRVSVDGTANVMQAALETGVKRVVHLSSTAVYGYRPQPDAATETGAYHYTGDHYCDGKIEGEKTALRYFRDHGLPVTVLRPTIVYGPFGDYTSYTVELIRQGRAVLVNGGAGVCNSLYVDNLVEAMLLAATNDSATGQVFHISDAKPVTWKEYIEGHAAALEDVDLSLPELTASEIAAARAELAAKQRISTVKQTLHLLRDPRTRQTLRTIPAVDRSIEGGMTLIRKLVPQPSRGLIRQRLLGGNKIGGASNGVLAPSASSPADSPLPLSESEVYFLTTFENVTFSIEKARQVLGYEPKIDFADGMARAADWIRWARL